MSNCVKMQENCNKILRNIIVPNLSSPSSARRLFCVKLLNELEINNAHQNKLSSSKTAYQVALQAEKTSATITEYRERIRLFDALVKSIDSDNKLQHELIVRYLLGSIYVNFEKLWGPTIRTVNAIIKASKWKQHLVLIVLDDLTQSDPEKQFVYQDLDNELLNSIPDCIVDILSNETQSILDDRPDFVLHRHLLYQILVNHSETIEAQQVLQKQFIDIFLAFVETSILVSPFVERNKTVNLINQDSELELTQEKDPAQDTTNIVQESSNTKFDAGHSSDKRRARDTFTTGIKVLKEFNNLERAYRSIEIKDLVLELLSSRDNSIQYAAFNCLLSFEIQDLKPYTDRIFNLLSDKKVRTELALFSVESDEHRILSSETGDAKKVEHIVESHRHQVMPIILRILFGKMLGRIGKRVSGRDQSELRKTIVMRFIAGCKTDEVIFYLNLVLGPLQEYINQKLQSNQKLENLDLTRYIPLQTLHAILMSLQAFIENVGHAKPDILPFIMKSINIIAILSSRPLQSTCISQSTQRSLKDIQKRTLLLMNKFFASFEDYRFSEEEIDIIYDNIVWTSALDFANRNQARATPLFSFIEILSKHQRYYPLLVKKQKSAETTLISCLMDLYVVRPGFFVEPEILKSVAAIINNILKGSEVYDTEDGCPEGESMLLDEEEFKPIFVGETRIARFDVKNFNLGALPSHFGMEIILGYTQVILERLQHRCVEIVSDKNRNVKVSAFSNDELDILSRIGLMIKDPKQCLICSKMLISTFFRQSNQDLKLKTIKTVKDMISCVDKIDDIDFLSDISNIFCSLRQRNLKHELVELLKIIATRRIDLLMPVEIISLMNAFDTKYEDQPDIVKINEAFRKVQEYLACFGQKIPLDEKSYDGLVLITNQVCFFISNNNNYEFSVRDNCLDYFERLSIKFKMNKEEDILFEKLVNDLLLRKFIKKGLRSTEESVRNMYISVLRSFAVNCHHKGVPWLEFFLFCDEQNLESDFWINVKHVQIHSRSKALAKLVGGEDINSISSKTLSSYFLPIASSFLFNRNYRSVAALALNSIKLIAKICQKLNWVTYEKVLSYYLDMLTTANSAYQSTNIKLITEIIKSFNFDISDCSAAAEMAEENKKLEKRMRRQANNYANIVEAGEPSRSRKLNSSTANMVHNAILKRILPKLFSCFHEATHVEYEHDKHSSDSKPVKEEIKRIPIAFAIIQILNVLPNRYVLFRENLPTLFMKLCSFLKSKSELVRKAARVTLVKVMNFLGSAYLPHFIRESKQSLNKGFQIHVLNYTLHSVLNKLPLHYGCLDNSCDDLIELCRQEIFGRPSEDKEVAQILAKTFEAKKTKSYDTILLLSTCISSHKLNDLMRNFIYTQMKTSSDPKMINKLSMVIQKLFTGLSKNTDFPTNLMLTFIEKNVQESLNSNNESQRNENNQNDLKKEKRIDRYIIEKDLPRSRIKSKISEKSNQHLIVENSLRLLLHTFQQKKELIGRKPALKQQLDVFVPLLVKCLKSSSPRCVTRSLKCILFISQTKADLANFKKKSKTLVKRIFILLNLYNGVGMARGDNYEMIMMCFKTLTQLLTHNEETKLTIEQLRALLSYIEQDINDDTRQATAFKSLQSILKRKLESPELREIMKKISELLLTSHDDVVRKLSVKNWSIYLLEYPHTNVAMQGYLQMFMRQIDYEHIDGRMSLLELFNMIITKFPKNMISDHFELLLCLLSHKLANEESSKVAKMTSDLIMKLIHRNGEAQQKYALNKIILPWSESTNKRLNLLAVKLFILLINDNKTIKLFDKSHVKHILNKIETYLQFISTNKLKVEEDKKNSDIDSNDSEYYESTENKIEFINIVGVVDELILNALLLFRLAIDNKLINCFDLKYPKQMKSIWINIAKEKLIYWHIPVVLASGELCLMFLKETNIAKALKSKSQNLNSDDYISWNAKKIVRNLCDKYIDLLDKSSESRQLENHIAIALIELGKIIAQSNDSHVIEASYTKSLVSAISDSSCNQHKSVSLAILDYIINLTELPDDGFDSAHLEVSASAVGKRIDLIWLSRKIIMQARKEAATQRMSSFHRRIFVLKWLSALVDELDTKRIHIFAIMYLMTPARELSDAGKVQSDDSPHKSMLTMCEDLLKQLKNKLGVKLFNSAYSRVQLFYTKKRAERKQQLAISKVVDQAKGVKRKRKESSKKTSIRSEASKSFAKKRRAMYR